MDTESFSSWPKRCARTASALVVLTALIVWLGWIFDIASLKSVAPAWPRMSPLTAVAFLLIGSASWLAVQRTSAVYRWLSWVGAGLAVTIGLVRLGDYIWGWTLGLDLLWFEGAVAPDAQPVRMSPATAFSFAVLGSAVLLVTTKRLLGLFQFLALLGCLVGGLSLSRYIYGGAPLLPLAQMAVHTSMLFFVLGAGVLCSRTDGGVMALVLSDTAGGALARRLLPPALTVPVALGWLRLQGERAGWYGTEAGLSLFALSNVVVFSLLIWIHGTQLHRSELGRRRANRRLRSQLERMNLLQHITRAIGERQDLKSIFQVVIRSLEEQLPVDFACICLREDSGQALRVECVGVRSGELAMELAMQEQSEVPVDENGLSQCMRGRLVYEPDIATVSFPFPQRLLKGGLRSLVIAPLQVESQVFGVLISARREPEAFDSTDCEFLRQLSEHVALAAHHAQVLDSLKSAYDDLRKTEQAVLQQERLRALGQMASGIAHDINNALSPAALYTDSLLESEVGMSERARSSLRTISAAIGDVAATVGRMREFYRQHEEAALEPVVLNTLVQQVVDLTRSRWSTMPQEHGVVVDLKLELEPDLPAALGIESEIREALTNLVFNAVDAMPEGGTLTVRTHVATDRSGRIQVEVVDTGVGMDEDTRHRCLEPFFTTKGDRGTGLGLAMVYGIAQRHGAQLEIDSKPGSGTTVRLRLVPASGGEAEASGLWRANLRPAPARILIIDDDPVLLRSLGEILTADGHSVAAAGSGREGVDMFLASLASATSFDVVITDLGMPYVDGRKVARSVKEASPSTPVVLLSGWGQRLVGEGEVPAHVDRVLSKPPRLQELRNALAESCRRALG